MFTMSAGPAACAVVIASPNAATASLKTLSREISPPYTVCRLASKVETTIVQNPSPRSTRLYPS